MNGGIKDRYLALSVVMAGSTMILLDVSVVNVALPNIMVSLGADVLEARWVVTAYMLAQAVVMPLTGWLGRRIGLGPLFIVSLIFFTAGTALCAASWSIGSLVVSRIIQAIGAGLIQPAAMSIITQTFPPHQRGRAIGAWGVSLTIGPMLGPTTAGYLIEAFDWRAAFLLNLPIGLAAIVFAWTVLRLQRDERPPKFDLLGYLSLATFLVVGMLTLTLGNEEGWDSEIIILGIGVSAFAFLIFLVVEWNYRDALVPMRLFLVPDFSLAVTIAFVRSLGMFGAFFLQPMFLQQVQGRDPIETGMIMVPAAFSFALAMPFSGWLQDRYGGRWPTVIGAVIAAYSFTLYWDLDFLSSRWAIIFPQFLRGLGMSLLMSPSTTVALNSVPEKSAGTASWIINLAQTFGGSIVIATLAAFLHRVSRIEMDRLGTAVTLNEGTPGVLHDWVMALGHGTGEAGSVAQALMGWSVGQAATTLAFHYNWMLVSFGLLLIVIPGLFLSHGGAKFQDS